MYVRNKQPNAFERNYLFRDYKPKISGFTSKSSDLYRTDEGATKSLSIECNYHLNRKPPYSKGIYKPPVYKLWLEAGNSDINEILDVSESENYNLWRKFCKRFRTKYDTKWKECESLSNLVAAMYPLDIPAPSHVKRNTYAKYIGEYKVFMDRKYETQALNKINQILQQFECSKRKLELRHEIVASKSDKQKQMVGHQNYAVSREMRIPLPTSIENTSRSLSRQLSRSKTQPHLWQLSRKLEPAVYDKLRRAVQERIESNLTKERNNGDN